MSYNNVLKNNSLHNSHINVELSEKSRFSSGSRLIDVDYDHVDRFCFEGLDRDKPQLGLEKVFLNQVGAFWRHCRFVGGSSGYKIVPCRLRGYRPMPVLSDFFPMDDLPTRVEDSTPYDDFVDSFFDFTESEVSHLDSSGISIDDVLQSCVIQEHLNRRKEVFYD